MREYLKTYKITLTTTGPVYVGSGKSFGKKEYVFISGNEVGIVDISKLYTMIQKKHLGKNFEEFMLYDNRGSLDQWLDYNKFSPREVGSCMKYQIKYGKLSLERGKRLEILEFVKDPYGNPYIPGSSLKGMLRTILLAADIMNDSRKYQYDKSTLEKDLERHSANYKFPAKSIRGTEAKCFNLLNRKDTKNDAVNDILSGMIVSDSEPLTVNDLVLCQRVERKVDGTEKKLNTLRECIKPGCSIRFDLTVDESICNIKAKQILSAVEKFAEMYNECFISKYKGMNSLEEDMVCLGGGVGFLSKTVVYPLFGEKVGLRKTQEIFEKTKVPRIHKHNLDSKIGVSPHVIKCAEYNGKTLQMGVCKIKIK